MQRHYTHALTTATSLHTRTYYCNVTTRTYNCNFNCNCKIPSQQLKNNKMANIYLDISYTLSQFNQHIPTKCLHHLHPEQSHPPRHPGITRTSHLFIYLFIIYYLLFFYLFIIYLLFFYLLFIYYCFYFENATSLHTRTYYCNVTTHALVTATARYHRNN